MRWDYIKVFDLYMVWVICDSEYFVFLECTIKGKYYFVNDKWYLNISQYTSIWYFPNSPYTM